MVVENNVSIKSNSNLWQKTGNTAMPAQYRVNPNGVDKTPKKDTVQLSTAQKVGIGIGATLLAALGTVALVKNHNTAYLKKSQQIFKDVFMNDNITIEETKEILKKYKDLSKIKDKEEYITALFNETRKNFGLGKEMELWFVDLPESAMGGGNMILTNTISLNKNWSREKLENAVFHELRHAKQDFYAINYDVNRFMESNGVTSSANKAHILPFLQRKCGLTTFSKENVPSKYNDYVENCYKGYIDYRSIKFLPDSPEKYRLYRLNFLEQDAWNNANKMTKLLYNFELN